jgi:hypothetical protein
MQYRVGTVSVENGSDIVNGTGTLWVGNVPVDGLFIVKGDTTPYRVSEVITDTQLRLTATFGGDTATGVEYAITVEITPNLGIPELAQGSIGMVPIYNDFARIMDEQVGALNGVADGLGTAATRDVVSDNKDATAGRVMLTGSGGILGNLSGITEPNYAALESLTVTRFSQVFETPVIPGIRGVLSLRAGGAATGMDIACRSLNGDIDIRSISNGVPEPFRKLYHTGNTGTAVTADVTTSATDTTAGRVLKVGDGGWLGNAIPQSQVADLTTTAAGFYTPEDRIISRSLVFARSNTRAGYIEMTMGGGETGGLFFEHYDPSTGLTLTGRRTIYHTGNLPDLGALQSLRGTWTPTLPNGGSISSPSGIHGQWLRNGDLVTVWFNALIGSIPNNGSIFEVSGLPSIPNLSQQMGIIATEDSSEDIQSIASYIANISGVLRLRRRGASGSVINSEMQPFNGSRLIFQMTYRANL